MSNQKPIEKETAAFNSSQKAAQESTFFKDWDKQKIDEHVQNVMNHFKDPMQVKNYLGTGEPGFRYYWSCCEDPFDQDNVAAKHEARLRLGWTPVNSRESVGDRAPGEPSRMGSSVIIREHKNGRKHMLIKIPLELDAFNKSIKEQMQKSKLQTDEFGRPKVTDEIYETFKKIGKNTLLQRETRSSDIRAG